MVGSFLAKLIGWITRAYEAKSVEGFLASIACALVLLVILRMRAKPKGGTPNGA